MLKLNFDTVISVEGAQVKTFFFNIQPCRVQYQYLQQKVILYILFPNLHN